jgi:hypothetical protein
MRDVSQFNKVKVWLDRPTLGEGTRTQSTVETTIDRAPHLERCTLWKSMKTRTPFTQMQMPNQYGVIAHCMRLEFSWSTQETVKGGINRLETTGDMIEMR